MLNAVSKFKHSIDISVSDKEHGYDRAFGLVLACCGLFGRKNGKPVYGQFFGDFYAAFVNS